VTPRHPGPSIALPPWIRLGAAHLTVEIAARPGSSRSAIVRADARGLVIAVAAPPERGRANQELIRTIADAALVPKGSITILRGEGSRRKTVRIETNDPISCAKMLVELGTRGS